MSATFDLAPLFDGDLAKAERTAALCENEYLEIKDVLKAPVGKNARVRWTMVTMAKPEILSDGIQLTRKSASKKLTVQGAEVTYRIWPSELEDYDDVLRVDGQPIEAPINTSADSDKYIYICGYEITIPAGQEVTLVATLK